MFDLLTSSIRPTACRFAFTGLHAPALVDAHFDEGGTMLLIRFDDQPTNRGGMNGVGACASVLDDDTSALLQGTSPVPAECYWTDDTTLIAQLTMHSMATGGMRVGLKPGTLWPLAWTYPGSCDVPGSKCTPAGSSLVVDADFPCDQRETSTRELCPPPTAFVQAPVQIDSCKGTSLTLDGTRSSGGGVRSLAFSWIALPRSCDNAAEIAALLATDQGTAATVTLGGEQLDGGQRFEVQLVVTNFLGVASAPYVVVVTRAAIPVPSVSINAPSLLVFPASGSVRLAASASIAPCFLPSDGSGAYIAFTWTHVDRDGEASGSVAPLTLDPKSRTQRDLLVRGSSLEPGVTYTLNVQACMMSDQGVCGSAERQVRARLPPPPPPSPPPSPPVPLPEPGEPPPWRVAIASAQTTLKPNPAARLALLGEVTRPEGVASQASLGGMKPLPCPIARITHC